MSESYPLFEIPIVSPDLGQEEMILQIADSLEYLNRAIETIFDRVNHGISIQKAKIRDLKDRTAIAKQKIDMLTGSKSATKVFSSAKYPASDVHTNFTSIFSSVSKFDKPPTNCHMSKTSIDSLPTNEKLHFFHVKSRHKMLRKNLDLAPDGGLGRLPDDLESVASLLLFNTSESPYKKYRSLDPMSVPSKIKNLSSEHINEDMAAISSNQILAANKETYSYSPSMGEVPNIDVPLDLPDLPGIAEDLKFNLDLDHGFAPSASATPMTPSIPELPIIPIIDELPVVDKPGVVVPPMPPPPPPPPPLPPAPPLEPIEQSSEPRIQLIDNTKAAPKPAPRAIPVSDNARANLMEAIRSAGGSVNARLRPIRENQDEMRRKKEEKAIAAGGDLMADLHNRLMMRRKGISGDKSNAMDKVSAMIPPPIAHHDTSSATEDDDWE